MAAYFNQKTQKWDANFSYKDYENNSKKKIKRGFKIEEDALAWEKSYKEHCKKICQNLLASSIRIMKVA